MTTRRSLVFAALDRYSSLVINVISVMILARLLAPAEVGIFSVTMALLTMAATVRDMGAGNYLLQEKELTTDRIRAVWAVQLGLGITLAVIVALASGPVADFYAAPAMRSIMLLLALNYLINPVGSLTYAWLMREMRYDAIAVMRFSSTVAGAVVSVYLAWRGHGAISLAWGSLTTTIVNSAVSMIYRSPNFPWRPSLNEVDRVLNFGVKLTGTSIFNSLSAAAPEFFLAKLQNMASAGFYSRANGLVALFNRLVTDAVYTVALSMFSRQARSGLDYGEPFLRALCYMTALSWSFCLSLVFLAHPTILVLYGDQWGDSVALTRWLALAAVFVTPVPLCTAALVGAGQMREVMGATLVSAAATTIAAAVGAVWGLAVLGPALVVAGAIGAAAWLYCVHRQIRFDWADLRRHALSSLAVAAFTAAGPALAVAYFGWIPTALWPALLLGSGVGVVGFLVSVLWLKHPLSAEIQSLWSRIRPPRN